MTNRPIALAADHAGFALKTALIRHLEDRGQTVIDLGTDSEASVDYPDYGRALAQCLADGRAQWGVAVCGSGIGISISANRHPAVRAALVTDADAAEMARRHNDANVIAFGARRIDAATATTCLDVFLATPFEGGRHARRVEKLADPV